MSKLISLGAGIACGAAVAVSLALPLPVKELSTWGKYGGLAVGRESAQGWIQTNGPR